MARQNKTIPSWERWYPYLLVGGGTVGLVSAFYLTMEKLHLLEHPNAQLICNLNPLFSCGSVILSKQASAFGFPNPYVGLAGFSVVITIGMALLAGATFKRWFWLGLQGGALFGLLFVHWLFYHSVFVIGKLCLFCMAVWAVTIPIFWYTTLRNYRNGVITFPSSWQKPLKFLSKNHFNVLAVWFLAIAGIIIWHFWYYIQTL